ncbi:cytochrome b [Legionella sp.]|uniref:cytochrome b n=1 Tax=Legionella sp. TaxID=459 RepID=UPI0032204F86
MRIKNTETHFGTVAILLHWIIALLIIGLLILGLYMVELPISLEKLKLYGWHKEYGLLALALVIIRLGWRLINITPALSLPLWEKIAARTVHWAFYGFMLAMPLTGWLITSSAGLPASFFGLFTLPDLVAPNEENRHLFEELHRWIGYGLIVTIILHTLAALKHHFVNKDDILRRMIS